MVLKCLDCGFILLCLSCVFVYLSEAYLWGAEVEIMHNVIQEFVSQTENETLEEVVQHRGIRVEDDFGAIVAEGGSNIRIDFKLLYNHPDKTSYEINPLFVKIISPLTMKHLNIHFDCFSITDINQHYSGNLGLKFPHKITLEMELFVAKHYSSCSMLVYFAEFTEFNYHPFIHPQGKISNKTISSQLWAKFLNKAKEITERYSFYILRKTRFRLGHDFGIDLCMIG